MKYYVLRYPNGSLVGIDYQSGGYPWEAWKVGSNDSLSQVKMWRYNDKGKEEALSYARSEFELAILECTITNYG